MATTSTTGRQHSTPHGTFYSLATQAIANTAAVQAIALEYDSDVHELTHSTVTNNSRITVPYTGSYEVIFSGIADLASGAVNKHIHIWPAIDGTAVSDSNTIVQLVSLTTEMTVAVGYILDMTAGQYVEMITWGDATTCEWLATAASSTPDKPACPSVIVTVKMISSVT